MPPILGQYAIVHAKLAKSKFQIKLAVVDPDSELKNIEVTGTSSDDDVVQGKNIEALGTPSGKGIALVEVTVEDIREGTVTVTLTATDEHGRTGSVDVRFAFIGADQSCNTIKLSDNNAESGWYDVTLGMEKKLHVYCDMHTLAPDGTKGGWTLFLSYFGNANGNENQLNMKTASPKTPYQYYPGINGDDFDLGQNNRDNNFKLPVPKLAGGDNTFIALTGTNNGGCQGAKAPHPSNWVFPKVIKYNKDNNRLNNWLQKNNIMPDDGNKAAKVYSWGLKCDKTNKNYIHRSWNWAGSQSYRKRCHTPSYLKSARGR